MDEIKIAVLRGGTELVDFDLTAGHAPKIYGASQTYADFINLPPRYDYSVRVEIPGYDRLAFWQGDKLPVNEDGIAVFDLFMPDDLYNTAPHVNLLQVKYQSRPQLSDKRTNLDWSQPILQDKPLVIVHSYRFVPQVRYQMGDISKILRVG